MVYGDIREYQRAEELYRRAIALPRTYSGSYGNLINTQIRNGRIEAAESTVAAWRARFPEAVNSWEGDWAVAYARDNLPRADSIALAAYRNGANSRQSVRGLVTFPFRSS